MKTVHLIRHGETKQNALKVWQGHTNTPLNSNGLQQAKLLSSRLKDRNLNIFSSDLSRAVETASFLSKNIIQRESLREINVGDFTGMSVKDTYTSNNDIFQSLKEDNFEFPNGETVKEFKKRVKNEIEYIFDNTEEDSETIVFTHGFFIGTVIGLTLGFNNYPFPIGNIENTSISTIVKRETVTQVNKLNDSIHLTMENIDFPAKIKNSALTFIRHGQTDSNLGGIWQGHIDNPLNKTGVAEARLLNNLFRDYDLNISSPYKRAHQTLSLITNDDIQTSNELTEMNLGKWEGLTTTEILEKYQEQFIEALFLNHKSKYGIDGESIYEAGARVEKLINKFEKNNYDGGAPFPPNFIRQGNRYATLRIDSFPSKWVIPRPIEVLFPVNVSYSERFPVIYMHDGQNIFHPNNAGFGKKGLERGWDVDFILDSLNETGFDQKAIIVGIFNTGVRRRAEYMPEEPREEVFRRLDLLEDKYFSDIPLHSDNYLEFLVKELKPYVDAHFKTLADREHTFIAGSSMGGMISAYAISKYPEIYGGAACLSTHWVPLD